MNKDDNKLVFLFDNKKNEEINVGDLTNENVNKGENIGKSVNNIKSEMDEFKQLIKIQP